MMKKMKKLCSILVTAAMLLSLLPVAAVAAGGTATSKWNSGLTISFDDMDDRRFQMMTNDQMSREIRYRAALAIAKQMLSQKIISQKDYEKIRAVLLKKHQPIFGALIA